jgi:polyhydroxybutyrate depolymerase
VTAPGDYDLTILSGGLERSYILHVPAGFDGSKSLPLVFILHGGGGTAKGMVGLTGMNKLADSEQFIVAYVDGTGDKQSWNTGIISTSTADDVALFRELANQLIEDLGVDPGRIYAAGFSNGGKMSHRLGAELSDVLAGVAVVESTIGNKQSDGSFAVIPTPIGPIPVLMIHGKQDTTCPYDGGDDAKSVADAVAFWTEADGCTGSPVHHVRPDGNIIVDDYADCAAGSEVKLVTIVNGQHQWPTLESQTEFSASEAIWKFFSRHSK